VGAGIRALGIAVALTAVLSVAIMPAARALPPPEPPRSPASASPAPAPSGATLPYGAMLLFVLDDKVSSASTKAGAVIRMHLKAPLVLNGVTIAPAGAPGSLTVVTTNPAYMGNEDGAVQIHLDPFPLAGAHQTLPIRAYHEYVTIERTTGQQSTSDAVDTVGDIFIPYHALYHYLRPGRQLVLPAGSIIPAQTAATIDASDPKGVVLSTPPPFESTYDPPHSDLTPAPLFTPGPQKPKPLPKGRPTIPPTPASGAPSPAVTTAAGTGASAPPANGQPGPAATSVVPAAPGVPATPHP